MLLISALQHMAGDVQITCVLSHTDALQHHGVILPAGVIPAAA